MNVPADVLLELAQASGAPTSSRAEGVVRWATGRLAEQDKALQALAAHEQLRAAGLRVLRYLVDEADTDHHGAVEQLRAALIGPGRSHLKGT